MKKIMVLAFLLIFLAASTTAQTIIRKNQFKLQPKVDSTTNLLIQKGRISDFTMIIDKQDTLVVSPIFATRNFVLKNIPKGEHTITFLRNKSWPFKDSLNHTFQFTAEGSGNKAKKRLPKLRYNNTVQTVAGFFYAVEIATVTAFFIIIADWGQG